MEILISVLQVVARHQCTLTNESTAPTKLDEGWEPQVCLNEASRVVELMLVSQRFQQLARSPLIRRPDHWTAEVARMSTAFCGAPGLEAFYACSEADQATLSPRSSEWSASETRSHLLGHPECAQHVDPRLDDHVNAHLLRHLPWRSLPPHVQAIRYARHVVHAIAKIDKEAAAATTAAWTDQVSGTARGDFRARGTARGDQHCLPVDPFPQPPTPSPTHSYALKNDPKWWWQASLPFEVEEALLQGGVSPERIQERWAAVCECIQQMVGQWGRDSARHRLNTSANLAPATLSSPPSRLMIVPMLATPFRCAVVQISEGPAVYVSQVRLLLFGDWSEFWEACSEDEEVVNLKEHHPLACSFPAHAAAHKPTRAARSCVPTSTLHLALRSNGPTGPQRLRRPNDSRRPIGVTRSRCELALKGSDLMLRSAALVLH